MESFKDDLSGILANTEKDNSYYVLEVLKDSDHSRIEKVRKDGNIFVRKYYYEGQKIIDTLSCLDHASFPKIYDSYRLADRTVVIEQYIEGITLYQYVKQQKRLSLYKAINLTLKLCEAVAFLHSQTPPIIHRDIKPTNIICTNNGIKVIDFNISRSYSPEKDRDTVYMGTVGYAPPEQFGFGQTDMRSDIYSIGKTFLLMITGTEPTRNLDKPALANLPDIIQKIICTSTDFTPQSRYTSVKDMIKDLESAKDIVTPMPAVAGIKIKSIVQTNKICSVREEHIKHPKTPSSDIENQLNGPEDRDPAFQRCMSGDPLPRLQKADPQLNAVVLKTLAKPANKRPSVLASKKTKIILGIALLSAMGFVVLIVLTSPLQSSGQDQTIVQQDTTEEGVNVYHDLSNQDIADHKTGQDHNIVQQETAESVGSVYVYVYRDLSNQNITDSILVSMIQNEEIPRNITDLNLSGNQIHDITPLHLLTCLTKLNLAYNNISDITSLQSLTSLTELELSDNNSIDISPLQSLTKLTKLGLASVSISDITPLKSLTGLTNLDLAGTNINEGIYDLAPLQSLTSLTTLDLSWNRIKDITLLRSLTRLTELDLSWNRIGDITPLQSLTGLKQLYLYNNSITDLSPLQSLKGLKQLSLYNNNFTDLSPLLLLTGLEALYLNSDISNEQHQKIKQALPHCEILSENDNQS